MSAHAYARPARRTAPGPPEGQPRLFALPGGAEALPLPEVAPQRPALASVPALPAESEAPRTAAVQPDALVHGTPEARAPRTLDGELRLAWTALAAGAPAACLLCGGRMEPHAHAPGGACTSCGTTLE